MKNLTITQNQVLDFKSSTLPEILPKGYLKEAVRNIKKEGLPTGFYTDISNLDNIFRLDKGRLITVTGIPNCGKSEFVDFLVATYNKKYGFKVLEFNPENQPYEFHISKLISKYYNRKFEDVSAEEIDIATDYILENFFYCNYDKVNTIDSIIKQLEVQLENNHPIDILVLDAYNKLDSAKPKEETETEFIGKFLDNLCKIALRFNIMIFLVAHPKKMEWKNGEKVAQCPSAYDINGSAHFFNKSDFVLAVHRDRKENNEMVKIRVDKVKFKHYGTQGECELSYDIDSGNYYNYSTYNFSNTNKNKSEPFKFPKLSNKKDSLDVEVSYYKGKNDNIGSKMSLKNILFSNEHKTLVEQIRKGETQEERKKIKNELAENIPAYTISGTFSKRGKEGIEQHTGLISIDIDYKDNIEIMPQVRDILSTLDYVAYCGKSISGDGYFAIIPVERPEHHLQHFLAIEEEMKSYGIVIDKLCKDVSRMRYVSYDDDYYYNPNASTYYWEKDEVKLQPAKEKKKKVKKKNTTTTSTSTKTNKEIIEEELAFIKSRNITIPDDYSTWFTTGMALNSAFGEEGRTYFHEFSKLSDKYDETECDTQYDNIVANYTEDSDIKLGSLIHIIEEAKESITN